MSLISEKLKNKKIGRLLDIATYAGGFIKTITDDLASYDLAIGVDISDKGIKEKPDIFADTNNTFLIMDGDYLGLKDNYFDLVSLCSGIHHLKEPSITLAEMKRVLKPGGMLIIREMFSNNLNAKQQSDLLQSSWHSKIDRLTGIFHNPSLKRDEIILLVKNLHLSNCELADYQCTKCNPETDGKMNDAIKETEERLLNIEHLPEYPELKKEAEYIIDYIKANGYQCCPELEVVGIK